MFRHFRPVLCKNSSAVKAAIHAGLAEKWRWNFLQKSVIENDFFDVGSRARVYTLYREPSG